MNKKKGLFLYLITVETTFALGKQAFSTGHAFPTENTRSMQQILALGLHLLGLD